MAAVPDTTSFTLQQVVNAVQPAIDSLTGCFADAVASKFDPAYSGTKTNQLNFRNYGAIAKYRIEDCTSSIIYTVINTYTFSLGDVVQWQVGTPGTGAVYCGTVIDLNATTTVDASLVSFNTYGCGDTIHCAT